jgi:3-hydroxyisobutyrate dehydrogenase
MNIAIIGGGEVGRAYAHAVATRSSHTAVVCDPRPKRPTLQLVDATGISLFREAGPWLSDMDRVWVCVTGDIATSVCRELLKFVRPGAVIVDLTTASPQDKRESFDLATEKGLGYVDAVILGAVALTGARTPLLAAGATAGAAMQEFVALGAPVRTFAQARAGDAAALKLLRTILTKGLEALAVECLVAAERQGVRGELYEAMSDVDATGFTRFLDMLVTTHVQHCTRRLHEVERAEVQLSSMGLPASMLAASQEVFARTTKAVGQAQPPAAASTDVTVALEWLSATAG